MSVEIAEEFDSLCGQLTNYDAYTLEQRQSLRGLKHVDLKSRSATSWPNGPVAVDGTRGNFNIMSISITNGSTTTVTAPTMNPLIDLSGFDPTDVVSLALPSFPLSSVDLDQSFFDITSSGDNSFSSQVASVALSSSLVTLIAGNSEFRVALADLPGVNLSAISSVRLRIKGTAAATVRVMAWRVLASSWQCGAVDIVTRTGRLYRNTPRNGDLTTPREYEQPIHWRAEEVPGPGDPRPIDAEISVGFNTGTIGASNSFTLYFREVTEDFMTQLDLNGMTMAELDGHSQPDLGEARYNPRTQDELSEFTQEELAGMSQLELERTPDYLSASWIQFVCQWNQFGGTVSIVDTEGNGYTIPFDNPLASDTRYAFFATLEENSAQATIYQLDAASNIGAKVFDSTRIYDDTAFKRRRGRFGWYADLVDGTAYLEFIRSRSMSYAEYRSLPLESNTPVIGAELFTSTSANIEHYTSLAPGIYNSTANSAVDRDINRSTTGESWKITNYGLGIKQGVQSNTFFISDFANSEIHFDLYYPSDAVTNGHLLSAFLVDNNEQRFIPLHIPVIIPDQWQHIKIPLPPGQTVLSDIYKLVVYQPDAYQSTWWIDDVSIFSRTIAWDGRAIVDDPWNSNDASWVPFKDNISTANGGVLFSHTGTQLQVRARGLTQDATISRIQFKPKYAELGRFKPQTSAPSVAPAASFSTSSLGSHAMRFTNTSTDSDGYVALVEWSFGDGARAIGHRVDHQYADAGPYSVTMVVMDNNGNRSSSTSSVSP